MTCVLLALGSAQAQGTITGTVVDETGKPLAGAKVHIAERDRVVGHRLIQYYETDDNGRFRIPHVPWGTYVLMAGKERAGYPDLVFNFYNDLALPTATLAEAFPSADVMVKVGPKAGVLELEPVTDAATGKEIPLASVTLRRADNPDLSISGSASQRRIFVPSLTRIVAEIMAEGYKSWPPSGAEADGTLFLRPEEIRKLRVALQPNEPTSGAK